MAMLKIASIYSMSGETVVAKKLTLVDFVCYTGIPSQQLLHLLTFAPNDVNL